MRALTAHGQTFAVPKAAVAANVHETFDVHGHFRTQSAFHLVLILDRTTQPIDLVVVQLVHATVRIHSGCLQDPMRGWHADPEDVRECDFNALCAWKIDSCDTSHSYPVRVSRSGALRTARGYPCR